MVRITTYEDLSQVSDGKILPYLENLLSEILKQYDCSDCSIEAVGAIYFIEGIKDLDLYQDMELSSPLDQSRFEWIEEIEGFYCNGCVVINNDTAINLIGKREYFIRFTED